MLYLKCRIAILREVVRRALIAQAEEQLAMYPQYRDHWNDWLLGVVGQCIQTKLGIAAEVGDLVLVQPKRYLWYHIDLTETFYSWRNRVDTSACYGVHPVRG